VATTSSSNYTSLYGANGSPVVPSIPYGNANVVSLLATSTDGSNTIGNISATGNISGNYFIGNGSLLTGIAGGGGNYSNANVAAFLPTFGGNVNATTVFSTTNIALQGQTWTQLQYAPGGAPTDQTNIGNGSWFYLDNSGAAFESNTTGTVRSVSFDNSGNISAVGNISGFNFFGNGAGLTGITVTAGTQLINGTSNVSVALNGNTTVVAGGTTIATFAPAGEYVTGVISATGNITGNYILGNGSQLTGLPATYGNANVVSLLAGFGSNTISTTGNITSGNMLSAVFQAVNSGGGTLKNASGASQLQWGGGGGNNVTVSVATNITPANAAVAISPTGTGTVAIAPVGGGAINNMVIGNVTPAEVNATTVSASGNITGSYFIGNGSALTGIAANYGNANVATFLANFGANTVSTTGNITGGNVIVPNVFGQYLYTNKIRNNSATDTMGIYGFDGSYGTVTAGNVNTVYAMSATGNIISAGNVSGGNLIAGGGVISQATMSAAGNITGSYFIGNGSTLSNLTGGNVVGAVANATYATTAGTATTAGSATTAVTVTGNAQANITSVGILTSLSVSGNVTGANLNAAGLSLSSNVISALNSTSNITTTANVSGGNLITSGSVGNITGANYITANYFVGNGALLTNVTSSGTSITNGTSTVAIGVSGGNANITIGGTSNVAVFATTGLTVTGTASVTGNITGGNITGVSGSVATGIINYKDYVYTITYASTITPDTANGSIQQVTLTGNMTLNAFGGTPQAGQSMVIKFIQDSTGSRTLSSTMKWAGGNKTLSTAANAVDIASIFYDGSTYYASLTTAYA
jgi:hypothetical protein